MPRWGQNRVLLPRQDELAIIDGNQVTISVPDVVGCVRADLPSFSTFEMGLGLWPMFFRWDFGAEVWRQMPGRNIENYITGCEVTS